MSVFLPKNVYFQPSATGFSNFLQSRFTTQYMRINVVFLSLFFISKPKFSEVSAY